MSGYFPQVGRSLLANGYLIIPIKPGAKSPALSSGWQKARLTAADLQAHPDCGVGILTGQGPNPVVGIDIDVSHPVICEAMLAWCRRNLGSGCERVGAAPRVLLAYRAEQASWTKGSTLAFLDPTDPTKPNGKKNEQRIEVLGLGQQFVAYHTHPDTGKDYEWIDVFGGLEHTRADDLPIVTHDQIAALYAEFERLVRSTPGLQKLGSGSAMGMVSESADDLLSLAPKVGLTLDQSKEYLKHLDNSLGLDYDTWLRVGMALQHEHGDDALDVWLKWSAASDKFDERDARRRWVSFGKHGGSPTTMRWLIKIANAEKADAQAEQQRECLENIKAALADAKDTVALTSETVRKVRNLLPENSAVRAEVFGLFQARFRALSGQNLPIKEVRSLLAPENRVPTVKKKYPLTEFGNADRMLDKFGHGLMFVPETESWYTWTGVYWRKAVDVEIEHIAKETIRALVREYEDYEAEAAEFFDFCKISQQARMVRNMVTLASSDPRVVVPAAELDRHKRLLGVLNGVVDLTTGELREPDPELRITRVCSCNYVPSARAPLWQQTLLDVFSDESEMVEYVQRVIGYSAIGDPTEDIMVIPHGTGANGKSTVFGTIRRVFGGYAKSADAGTFVADGKGGGGSAGGPREDLLRLRGARFCYVNEPDENSELREGSVKSMTGGDAISTRGMYAKESIEIIPSWVVFMPTNHKPIIKGNDYGIWRRLVLLPFERNFETDPFVEKDGKREEKLEAESEGVLNWIVQGARAYLKVGLRPPERVRRARDAYRSQMDLLSEWIDQCCEEGPAYSESMDRLWKSWQSFALEHGILHYVKSSVALARRLDQRFPAFKGSGGKRMRIGIRIATIDDSDDFF